MLKRLYKKEVEQVVMRHEEYRQALQRELEQKQNQQEEEQALADLDELDKELAKYWPSTMRSGVVMDTWMTIEWHMMALQRQKQLWKN